MSIILDLFLILSFVLSTLLNFLTPLKFTFDLSMTFIFSIGFVILFYFLCDKQRQYLKIITISYFIIGLITFPLLKAGLGITLNTIIKAYNEHSQFGFSPLTFASSQFPALACNSFLMMSSIPFLFLTVQTFKKAKSFTIPFLISLFYIGIPLLFNIEAQRFILFFYLASIVTIFMINKLRKQKQLTASLFPLMIFSLVFCLLFAIQTYYPENTYQRNEWVENIRKNISNKGIQLIFDLASKRDENKSNLLSAGNRYYTGKVDLTIQANSPVDALLKGTSFMHYQNNEWSNPELNLNYLEHEKEVTVMMDRFLTDTPSFNFQERTMIIENTSTLDRFMYLPYFISKQNDFYNMNDTSKGFYFSASNPSYSVLYNDVSIDSFDTPISSFDEENQYAQSHYLQIPENTKEIISNYLNDRIHPYMKREEIVNQVVEIVKNSANYTLSPGLTPENRDFIDYFLNENKQGYCVHFATTATMMLRFLNIPARYVEGYHLNSQDFTNGTAYVRDNQAHAWVEVYFYNLGWIPFDVTPSDSYDPIHHDEETWIDNEEETNLPSPENPNTPNQNNTPQQNTTNTTPQPINRGYLFLIVPVILLSYGLFRYFQSKKYNVMDNRSLIIYRYKQLLKLTPNIEDSIYQLVLKARFSQHSMTNEDVQMMETYYHQAKLEVKKRSPLLKKVWITLFY